VGENGDFQPLETKISRNSQTVSNAATVTINHQLEICCRFLRQGLHTRTAVARLPLRQLGFLVHCCEQRLQKLAYTLTVELIYRIFLLYHVTGGDVRKRTVILRRFGIH